MSEFVRLGAVDQSIASKPLAVPASVYLEGKPHPSLGEFEKGKLAIRIAYAIGHLDALVRSRSVLIPRSHVCTPYAGEGVVLLEKGVGMHPA